MMETIVGDNGSRFIIAAGAVAIGLLCLVAVLWIMRNRPSSPFVRGGRNRQPRLAVLDAAAVDTRRRLVLVRRDDVEHLIMIGGPTDIVIESRIAPEGAAVPGSTRPAELQGAVDTPVAPASPEAAFRQAESPDVPQKQADRAELRTHVSAAASRSEPAVPSEAIAIAVEPVRPTRAEESVHAAPRAVPAPAVHVATGGQPNPPAPPPTPAITPLSAVTPLSAGKPSQESSGPSQVRVPPIMRTAEEERSVPTAQTPMEPRLATQPQPAPARPSPAENAVDFERILDAEISSDLQRLTPTVRPRQPSGPIPTVRQEPVLGAASAGVRKEPTIDEEMTRMLADISAGRKP